MAIRKNDLNTQLASINNKATVINDIADQATKVQNDTYVRKATVLGQSANDVKGGLVSLEAKIDHAGEISTEGDVVVQHTEAMEGAPALFDPAEVTMSIGTPSLGAALSKLDSTTINSFDSGGAFSEIFNASELETIGGDLANTVSVLIQLITQLGTVAKLTDIANGGSALDAIKQTQDNIAAKGQGLVDDLKGAVDTFGSVQDAANFTEALNKINKGVADVTGVAAKVAAVATLNPTEAAALVAADVVNNYTGNNEKLAESRSLIKDIKTTTREVGNLINKGINAVLAPVNEAAAELNAFINGSPIKTGLGLVQDIAEEYTREASFKIDQLAYGVDLDDQTKSRLLQKVTSGDKVQETEAVLELARKSRANSPEMQAVLDNISEVKTTRELLTRLNAAAEIAGIPEKEIELTASRIRTIETELVAIDTTISGSIIKSAIDFYNEDYSILDNASRFNGADTELSAFTYIDSKEELGAEIRSFIRRVSEVVIHASETYTNANIGAEELHVAHKEDGLDGIQYHYIIRRDGRLQRGRPPNKSSQASSINGHDKRCIDLVLIGGINAPSGTENPSDYLSSTSFTIAQMATLEAFLEAFYRRYPGGQVFGHNEIFTEVEDPYFDVSTYVETLFRKKSVYTDLLNDTAIELDELVTKRPV
jgi:hypothetical protein